MPRTYEQMIDDAYALLHDCVDKGIDPATQQFRMSIIENCIMKDRRHSHLYYDVMEDKVLGVPVLKVPDYVYESAWLFFNEHRSAETFKFIASTHPSCTAPNPSNGLAPVYLMTRREVLRYYRQ